MKKSFLSLSIITPLKHLNNKKILRKGKSHLLRALRKPLKVKMQLREGKRLEKTLVNLQQRVRMIS